MSLSMKKTALAAGVGLALAGSISAAEASLTLTFTNGTAEAAIAGPCSGIAWTAGNEFRMCDPTNAALGGGLPLQKNTISGGETYTFADDTHMTGVTGTPGNPGASYVAGSAAPLPGTNPTWQQNAAFFGPAFNFLAPTLGSLAGNAYGAANYVGGVPTNGVLQPFIHAPVLEAQWGGTYFPLGQVGNGITFYATITGANTIGNTTTFTFDMFANHTIASSEDPGAAGFTGWTAQWHQQGTGVYVAPAAIPVPAAAWLFGSGLLGLVGIARRKKAKV